VVTLSIVFYPQISKESALPVYVSGVGISYDQRYVSRPAIYSKQILITVSGSGRVTVGGQTYSVSEGTGFYLNSVVESSYEPDPDTSWIVDWVTFDISADEFDESLFTSKDFLMFDFKRPALISDSIKKILESVMRDSSYGGFFASSILYSMLIEVNGEILEIPERPTKHNPAVSAAIEYINNHFNENITLEDLCLVSGKLSEQYFCRLFKQYTGMRPVEYILSKRIDIARGCLENTDMPISEVAELAGFNNTSYFYRNFKKFTGVSPLTCRQNALYYRTIEQNHDE